MAQINLNIPLLRDGTFKEQSLYFHELRQNASEVDICHLLFSAVDQEHIKAQVVNIFLCQPVSPSAVALCILHGRARSIRKRGIKEFGKAMADPKRWEQQWEAIGGTKGLVGVFAKISVSEVRALAKKIGVCNRVPHNVRARDLAVEELLHALLPSHYPQSTLQSREKRPIKHFYAMMVPACSSEFVARLLDSRDISNPLYQKLPTKRLISTHGDLLQSRVMESMLGNRRLDEPFDQYLEAFVYREPPRPCSDSRESESMAFATKILQLRVGDIVNGRVRPWPGTVSEANILQSILVRCLRRRLPETHVRDMIMLGLQLLDAKPDLKPSLVKLWPFLMARWKRAPEFYEGLLVFALRLGIGARQTSIGADYYQSLRTFKVKPALRWPLLRLFCLHVPKNGVDIDTADDLKVLARQPWSTDMFYQLSKQEAIRLLEGLYKANPGYSFLGGATRPSILCDQNMMSQKNFNVVLFLAMLHRDSKGEHMKAVFAVNELQKRAAISREQPHRAELASAAAAFSIASGNLDLYGETVKWQQRYVRDPLTTKQIFRHYDVLTKEGIELLSGIPDPLPEGITLREVASRVEKANQILQTFHDTMLLAKQEPSYQRSDWSGVTSLFGAVIGRRASRDLKQLELGSQSSIYSAIWAGTLAMLSRVNVDFLTQAVASVEYISDYLPPTALVEATEAMLKAGNERRQKKDREPGDNILEQLSYSVLRRLVNGEKPELAQQLVLRTIIERPDASSWHRQILTLRFLNSLAAEDAHQMLFAFATAIGEKMEEQSYVKIGETQQTESLVKVTTVKHLAQLLDNAAFISADAAVDVLVELFKVATHRDIRLATLESLLGLLNNLCIGAEENWGANDSIKKILDSLETVIPVLGSINERRPPRQEDWEDAAKTGILPEISDVDASLPPILKLLIMAPVEREYPGLRYLRAEFVSRFFLPILFHSQMEHQKWISLFLAKHKASFTVHDLPPTPITHRVWTVLLGSYPEYVPEEVLYGFNRHMVMTIAPPAPLKHFNKSLRIDVDLRSTPEVKHWFSVFGECMDQYHFSGTQILVRMIHHSIPISSVPKGITFAKVFNIVVEHASLFLADYERYPRVCIELVHDLRHPTKTSFDRDGRFYNFKAAHPGFPSQLVYQDGGVDSVYSVVSTWQKTGRLLLERVASLVLDKNKELAQHQKRSTLPSSTKLRLWLLPYPCYSDPIELIEQCEAFAKKLEEELGALLTGASNALRWPKITEDALTVSAQLNTEERLRVALHIGKLTGTSNGTGDIESSALNFVRIELAMKLIYDGKEGLRLSKTVPSEHLVQGLREMVREWQSCFDGDIREKAECWREEKPNVWQDLMIRDLDVQQVESTMIEGETDPAEMDVTL
ncbi:hypothetical protein V494_01214 [Pseudogymnoascus sp. VKM F-4513 (FW-928)]|nr:hypothetical protein V494_01214 [Pseudogymnoascus sp. VKM F-4513 (FW-928)]